MSNIVKYISIKNRTYYFFNDIIYIEDFDANNNRMDDKSYDKRDLKISRISSL